MSAMISTLDVMIDNMKDIYVYGAQATAYGAACAIAEIFGVDIVAYIVSNLTGNPSSIDGRSVRRLKDIENVVIADSVFIIAVPEYLHAEIVANLQARGCKSYFCLDADSEFALMSEFLHRT